MPKLKETLMLTDKGYSDLKKAIAACTVTNLSLMLPFGVTIQLFAELLKPLMGQEISPTAMWILLGCGIVAAILVFLASKKRL
jgi:ATP-binding cassette subfamily B protein